MRAEDQTRPGQPHAFVVCGPALNYADHCGLCLEDRGHPLHRAPSPIVEVERVVEAQVTTEVRRADLLIGRVLYLGVAVQGSGGISTGPATELAEQAFRKLIQRQAERGALAVHILYTADAQMACTELRGPVEVLAIYAEGEEGSLPPCQCGQLGIDAFDAGVFVCAACRVPHHSCFGGADDDAALCDDCWSKAHVPRAPRVNLIRRGLNAEDVLGSVRFRRRAREVVARMPRFGTDAQLGETLRARGGVRS